MKLRERYKRLTFWNKVGFWGAIASIVGIPTTIYLSRSPSFQDLLTPEQKLTGLLMPANESDPTHGCNKKIPADAIKVYMGSNVAYADKREDLKILRLYGMDILSIKITPLGVYLSAIIFREDGRIMAKIVNNQFLINPNNYFKLLRPDRHEITVYDKDETRVLFVRFLNEKSYYVEGVFQVPGQQPLIVTRNKLSKGGMTFQGGCAGNYGGAMFRFD